MKKINFASILLFATVVLASCDDTNFVKDETLGATDTFNIYPNPYIPSDVAVNASEHDLVTYAWMEFLALNWKSSYGTSGLRADPDLNWNFQTDTAPFPDTVVWETFAHRTELSPTYYPLKSFDAPSNYANSYAVVPTQESGTNATLSLFNNLDETSEIGSCELFAHADVFGDTVAVRYQAKVNRVEYNYIQSFPARSNLLAAIDSAKGYTEYQMANSGTPPANRYPNRFSLPDSSVEVKTAWRPLTRLDDPTKFFTRKVIVYRYDFTKNAFVYNNKTYALIGLHIIHKSPNHPSFVFATWEHVSVQADSMKYIELDANSSDPDSTTDRIGGLVPPIRNPITATANAATEYVHNNVLPRTSIWQNYRLVGVQGTPVPIADSNTAPNFFLANYVVESDPRLARFNGSRFSKPFDHGVNVVYNNTLYSEGGCQGCHGAGAQRLGQDFSFVVGDSVASPDTINNSFAPYLARKSHAKLDALIKKYK